MGEKTFFSVEIRGRRAKKSFSEAGPEADANVNPVCRGAYDAERPT